MIEVLFKDYSTPTPQAKKKLEDLGVDLNCRCQVVKFEVNSIFNQRCEPKKPAIPPVGIWGCDETQND